MNLARTIVLGLPLLAGCATEPSRAEQLRAQYRDTAVLREKHANDPSYRSPEGFEQARWGMSMGEVRALYPDAKVEGSTLLLDAPLADRPAHLTFRFVDDRLSEVRAALVEPQGQYERLDALLTRKYGHPDAITPDPSGEDTKRAVLTALDVLTVLTASKDHVGLASQNVQTHGQLSELQAQQAAATQARGAIWNRPETRITLASDPKGAEALVVDYVSRALMEKNQAAAGHDPHDAERRALDSL